MKKVYLIIYDLGGGHRSSANALKKVIEKQKLPWQVEVVEVFREVFGTNLPQYIYNNWVLKKKWARIINDRISVPLFKLQIRLRHSAWHKRLRKYWHQQQPDLVVSMLPLVNKVLYESLQAELPSVPFVTLPVELADCPPNYYIEPQEQLFICTSKQMLEQTQQFGYQEDRLFHTSGVVINSQFYEPIAVDRSFERKRLGLDPDLPTGLVMFGGYGSDEMIKIAESLENSPLNIQLIFICGHNEKLANTLRHTQGRLPRYVETFTKEIPYYMYLSDFFIGKPGYLCISEAVTMKLPVITECNALTMFQERYSAEWSVEQGVGIVVSNFQEIDRAVTELLIPENFARYRDNAAAINNQAVFEVVEILERILESSNLESEAIAPSIVASRTQMKSF